MKMTRIGLAALSSIAMGVGVIVVYKEFVPTRLIETYRAVESFEYEWRVLTLTTATQQYNVLAKLGDVISNDQSRKVARVKVERVTGGKIHLLCEYMRDRQHSVAERFDASSQQYLEVLEGEPFQQLNDAMEGSLIVAAKSTWSLGPQSAQTVDLAMSLVSRCEGTTFAPSPNRTLSSL